MPVDVSTLLSALSFLVSVYQAAKPNQTIVNVLNEVKVEVESRPHEDPRAFVEERLNARLDKVDAQSVHADLALLDSFLFTGTVESFNYCELLRNLFSSVHAFCLRNNLFVLRGFPMQETRFPAAVCDATLRKEWMRLKDSKSASGPATTAVSLYLTELGPESNRYLGLPYSFDKSALFPFVGTADIAYEIPLSMGGLVSKTGLVPFYVFRGSESHWLAFISDRNSGAEINYQRMLRSVEVQKIVEGVRSDLLEYVNDIKTDKAFSDSTLKTTADKFLAALNPSKS